MSVKYSDREYARNRLEDTIVLYQGEPVTVLSVGERTNIKYLEDGRNEDIDDYQDLDLTPVPLGNIEFAGNVSYIMRIPLRRDWRQGLRARQIYKMQVGGMEPVPLKNHYLYKTIKGIYRTFEKACQLAKMHETSAYAFSRAFAVNNDADNNLLLVYKAQLVGTVEELDGKMWPSLFKEKTYLREVLEKDMGNE